VVGNFDTPVLKFASLFLRIRSVRANLFVSGGPCATSSKVTFAQVVQTALKVFGGLFSFSTGVRMFSL